MGLRQVKMPQFAVLTKIHFSSITAPWTVASSCLIFRVLKKLLAVLASVLAAFMDEWLFSGLYIVILKVSL